MRRVGGSVLIRWRRCCRTAVRRGSGAPTNFKSGHYRAWDELDARHSKI